MLIYQPSKKITIFPLFFIIATIHSIALVGLFLYPPTWTLVGFTFLYITLIPGLGVTLGYHRCLAHKAFEFKYKWMERLCVTFASCSMQLGPIWWCSLHRLHHKYSDSPKDPHTGYYGFWYSHFLWILRLDPRWKIPTNYRNYQEVVKDIASDYYYQWLDRYPFVPWVFFLLFFYLLGGFKWMFWGGFISLLFHFHMTWTVNSISHRFGTKKFKTRPITDNSVNNWFVAAIAYGEGWHNNHHAFPRSAKHGFFSWWEFDLSYLVILALNFLGLIKNVKTPSHDQINAANLKVTQNT